MPIQTLRMEPLPAIDFDLAYFDLERGTLYCSFTSSPTHSVDFHSPWPTPKSSRLIVTSPESSTPPAAFRMLSGTRRSRVTPRSVSLPTASRPPSARFANQPAAYCAVGRFLESNRDRKR